MAGCSPRRTVSTSGNSGIGAFTLRGCRDSAIAAGALWSGGGVDMMNQPDETTHFGFRDVRLGDKQTLVNEVFHSVARRYDLMNDLMSGGLHRVWKDIMITQLNPPKGDAPFALLDVAGGTGDISFRAAKASGLGFHAT